MRVPSAGACARPGAGKLEVCQNRFDVRCFVLYGVPVGSDSYCSHKLMEIAKKIQEDAKKTAALLSSDRQALWSALRCSIVQRFDYWLQLSYPSVVAPVARWLDDELWKILETAFGFHIPRRAEGNEWDCVLPVPVQGRADKIYQEWMARLPVRQVPARVDIGSSRSEK